VTKSDEKAVTNHKNNALTYDEICHKITQFKYREGGQKEEILELIDALQKIGYFKSFRVKETVQLSGDKSLKPQERTLKHRRKAAYRRIKKYYKSPKQYQKERLRRKLCWLLSGKYKESEIAEMLGISRRTVIRDMNRIKPYYFRMSRAYFSKLEQERIKEFNLKMEGATLKEQLKILTEEIEKVKTRYRVRQYLHHYQIIMLDLTQLDPYGIPKLTIIPGGKGKRTLAFPHKIRIHIKASYEGREFTADIGGIELTQTSGGW
jgi:transposase